MVKLVTISVSVIGNWSIEFHAKGNINISVSEPSLQTAYNQFFRQAKKQGLNLTSENTAFIFNWE